ncbi:putative cenp-o kinetochore centromere component [Diaporthe ampelina]|uniref:Putative cenp-o kinetochore centromere component n=1 Tax=Diaporthe ampelina TaxID=1214573 RepID=A0A0G2I1D7_9PEZI|nr:putative cenp-o kinetochore centromere component [Diaporthe ampelina]
MSTVNMTSEADIDDEISDLRARVETLRDQVRLQASILLTTGPARQAITADTSATGLQERLEKQIAYDQHCLYRACAGITTFRVRDPDPNAVDGGNVLGVRIEVMTRSRFLRPYFVLLNRPYSGDERRTRFLRVHRHTVPPCIPLAGLAARYLPAPRPASTGGKNGDAAPEKRQDLSRFVRCLRRDIVRYHNRLSVIADLRRAVGLDGKRRDAGELAENSSLLSISAADTEAKQVRVDWKDGRSGRLVIGDDGDVVKLVVFGDMGRDRELTRELLSDGSRLEHVARKLGSV